MSTSQKPQRWTAAAIRKATPHPKPQGALAKEWAFRAGGPAPCTELASRRLLAHIINHADALDVATDGKSGAESRYDREPTRWLLVPMPPLLMQLLEQLGAEEEGIEDGGDTEDDGISEEPSLGAAAGLDQSEWGMDSSYEPDREEDDPPEDDGIDEPELGWSTWAPDWQPWRLQETEVARDRAAQPPPGCNRHSIAEGGGHAA